MKPAPSAAKIEVVSATRLGKAAFRESSALGVSLRRLAADSRLSSFVAYDNRGPLADLYNARIASPKSAPVLVFMHDDVWIDDYFFIDRLLDALARFELVGVAGNRRRYPGQPAWAIAPRRPAPELAAQPFNHDDFDWDAPENLSGALAHGTHPFGQVWHYGPTPAACELLDGVMLAARRDTLRAHGLGFDRRFAFNFYDLDFCRAGRAAGLRLGTWPICLTHQSGGAFDDPHWHEALALYRGKWPD